MADNELEGPESKDLMTGGSGGDQRYQMWLPGQSDGTHGNRLCGQWRPVRTEDTEPSHRMADTLIPVFPEFELIPEKEQQKEKGKTENS